MRKHVVDAFCVFTFATAFTSLSTILREVGAVKLTSVTFPDVIRNGSVSEVVLDCEYSMDDKDRQPGKLPVVKWFFNGDPQPVYQWIPPDQKPQDLGVLKGRLNLGYRASQDRNTMHRALQIVNPTTELSGEYMCQISTFDEEQTLSKKMIIFEPEKSFEIVSKKESDNSAVNITCTAEGIFPEPQLTITSSDGELEQEVSKVKRDGVYDIASSVMVDDASLPSPTQFDCELQIPEANYTKTTGLLYYPGPPTTTAWPELTDTSTEYVPDANHSSVANSARHQHVCGYAWLLFMAAFLPNYRL